MLNKILAAEVDWKGNDKGRAAALQTAAMYAKSQGMDAAAFAGAVERLLGGWAGNEAYAVAVELGL